MLEADIALWYRYLTAIKRCLRHKSKQRCDAVEAEPPRRRGGMCGGSMRDGGMRDGGTRDGGMHDGGMCGSGMPGGDARRGDSR